MVTTTLTKTFSRKDENDQLRSQVRHYTVLAVEAPVPLFPRYAPPTYPQTTTDGIDRLDAKLPREWINEDRGALLASSLLHIECYARFCRISLNRELFTQSGSYRTEVLTIMYDLFNRGLFVVPLARESEGQVKLYTNRSDMSDDEAFKAVLDQLKIEGLEYFFDSPKDLSERLSAIPGMRTVKNTVYTDEHRRMRQRFFEKKSFLKEYDKVECKLGRGEPILMIEARNRYRIELTLQGTENCISWKALDTDNIGLIDLVRQHLSHQIDKVCPELRSLVDERDLHPELRKVLQTPAKKRRKFDRGLSRILKEGRSDWREELREVMAEAERGCAESGLEVVSDEVNQDAPEVRVEVAPAPDSKPLKSGLPTGLGWPIREDLDQYPRTSTARDHGSRAPGPQGSSAVVDLDKREGGRDQSFESEGNDFDRALSRNKGTRITKGAQPPIGPAPPRRSPTPKTVNQHKSPHQTNQRSRNLSSNPSQYRPGAGSAGVLVARTFGSEQPSSY